MKTFDFCKKMDIETKIAIKNWAKFLGTEELTIHRDGTVTMMCKDGCIGENDRPTRKELERFYKKNR